MPAGALLHIGHAVTSGTWNLEPTILAGALFIFGIYVYGVMLADEPLPDWRIGCFLTGWLVMLMALISPLDYAAHRLLSMHMLQHVALTTAGPPLVLLGLTRSLLKPVSGLRAVDSTLRIVTLPAVAGVVFITNMWLWHMPPVYETALNQLPVHVVMHLAFMATAFLFWWPVIRPLPQVNPVGEGARLLYLFVTGFPMALLALLLVASPNVVYDYYEKAPRLWGLSALEDQQIAGVIMGALGETASFVAITWLFFRYLDREGSEAPTASQGPADVA